MFREKVRFENRLKAGKIEVEYEVRRVNWRKGMIKVRGDYVMLCASTGTGKRQWVPEKRLPEKDFMSQGPEWL